MAKLSYQEKSVLEELFGMSTGYVMDFSNNTYETKRFGRSTRCRAFSKMETYKIGCLGKFAG